jgi:hypothetical protein
MKNIIFTLAAIFMALMVNAQSADFTGKWKLNSTKSTLNDQFSMAPNEIIVNQETGSINVEKHSSFQGTDFTIKDKYTLDGQESVNEGWQGTQKKSVASWDGNKQLLTVKSKLPMQDGTEVSITEVYKMKDNDLVIESHASSSYGDLDETMVYDRQ